jgi:hypothetical protein
MRELAEHDDLEVAALSGGLQLLPGNASHGDRLVALAAAALSGNRVGTSDVTRDDLARWLLVSPSLHTGSPWDPYEGPFAEPLNFIGGGYLMLTGGDPSSVFQVRMVLRAMFGDPQHAERNESILHFALGVLALSTHICGAANIRRWASANSSESVVIPTVDTLGKLRTGVRYTRSELAGIIGVAPTALDPIVHDLDAEGAPTPVPEDTQFTVRPLLRRGDTYVLVEPGALAIALRHGLLTFVLEQGLRSDFVEQLALASVAHVAGAAEFMDWKIQRRLPASDAPIVSLVGGLDSDKAVDIAIVYEDLEGYSQDPLGSWDVQRWEDALARHLTAVEEGLLFGPGERPNEVLHLIVLAGCGRPYVFGLPESYTALKAPQLLLSLEELHQVSMGAHEQLRLWKYARASDRLRRYCQVIAFGPLDEFAAWNEDQSYYFGDDARPTLCLFDGSHGRAFREKVARETDVHGVLAPREVWVEAVRLHKAEHIPIYGVLHDLGGEPLTLVEGAPLPVWIRAYDSQPEHRMANLQIVDCLAYWVWQFTPSLSGLAKATSQPRFIVDVELEDPEVWTTGSVPAATGDIATAEVVEDGVLRLTVHPSLIRELDRADNSGERALVRTLLMGVDSMLSADISLGKAGVDAAIEQHAPLGQKKKINLLSAEVDSALIDGALPPYRWVSPADTDQALDEAGAHIAQRFLLTPGPIEGERREQVLNGVVAFHIQQLEQEVAILSSAGLLEHLISIHEAVVRHEAVERCTLGARIAAFGETGLLEQMRRSLPEATQTAVALRFLIEYVTARPPGGLRPISLDVYDRLLALCGQIVSRGRTSDIIHFGIEDTELNFLDSGRLGVSGTGRYHAGQQTFLDALIPAHARAVGASYEGMWNREPRDAPPEAEEINAASSAEWGFSLSELLEFFAALSLSAHEGGNAAASLPCSQLEAELATKLGWPAKRVGDAIVQFSLGPRENFSIAPPGFRNYELWPWRFNRSLSYMRRPLLRRPGETEDEFVWGVRQPEQVGRFLLDLITSERLRARSNEMKQLMTRLRHRETQQFVDQVAALHRDHGMAVDTNVKKVAGEKITRDNNEDLTDVDVLAADPTAKVIYALECKDLEGARTPAELDNELANTFRSGGKKRSAADKQLERVAWLAQRIPKALHHLGIEDASTEWRVEGAIVTDVHVMSPHVADCCLPVYAWTEIRDRVAGDTSNGYNG